MELMSRVEKFSLLVRSRLQATRPIRCCDCHDRFVIATLCAAAESTGARFPRRTACRNVLTGRLALFQPVVPAPRTVGSAA